MINRKKFIPQPSLALTGSLSIPLITKASAAASLSKNESKLKEGIAGYTFAHFYVEKSIDIMKRLDVHYLSSKDFHLQINSDDAKIENGWSYLHEHKTRRGTMCMLNSKIISVVKFNQY